MAECLKQLKSLEIVYCNSIQLIISIEEPLTKEDGKRDAISFPRLNSLKLKRLHNLIGFCHEDYVIEFQSLNILEIAHCPELKGFITNKTLKKDIATTNSATDEVLFNEKVVFPNLEKMTISHLRNVKRICYNQLHQNSFCNLKELKVEYCDGLLNILSSSLLGVFQGHLEMLTVTDCASLEQVFELEGSVILPCAVEPTETQMLLPRSAYHCVADVKKVENMEDIPQLEEVYFTSDDIAMISDGKFASNIFSDIKSLGITDYLNQSIVFPFCFLQKFHNLQMLEVVACNFKELSPYESDAGEEEDMICTLPKIKRFKLNGCYKITQLWKQDSRMDNICASFETLEVWSCYSLINLASASSSFQNLTYLDVLYCKGMTELIVSSKAQSLGCLVRMKIRECEMMTEIVASEGAD
ncbi:hypothetical protein PTKIN_Ptkin01aG0399000 [Pterospermum kingtungense]